MARPPLESTAPSDWRYTAEGGANLVLSFVGPRGPYTGKLLRLRKRKLSHATGTIPDEVDVEFGRQIIQPLLGPEQVVEMERLEVSRDWLAALKQSLALSGARPAQREAEDEMDEQSGVVVLAEDLIHGQSVLAVEIKPKWGFLPSPTYLSPTSRDVKTRYCRFCMHSYTKRSEEDPTRALEEHQTGYCPLDLYSGDGARVTRAVEALWNAWVRTEGSANNLRFFYEGMRVESRDTSSLDMFLSSYVDHDRSYSAGSSDLSSTTTLDRLTAILVPVLLASPLLPTLARLQSSLDALDIEGLSSQFGLRLDDNSAPPSPLLKAQPSLDDWKLWLATHSSPGAASSPLIAILSYLLSATFKDCSIFIRLAPSSDTAKPFTASVKAIDLDPKSLNRLPKYYDVDRRIVQTWSSMLNEHGAEGIRTCVE